MIHSARIAIIGFGNMGKALAEGFINNGINKSRIHAVDPSEKAEKLAKELGIDFSYGIKGLARPPSVFILAVKPQIMAETLLELKDRVSETTCFLSIAAGVSIKTLQNNLGDDARIIRAMPNTPVSVGLGATGLCHSGNLAFEQMALAEMLMQCVGRCDWVDDESLIDVVTAISGSGTAYFFLLMEEMIAAAITKGMDEELARKLVVETCRGAGELAKVKSSEMTVSELRESVTSKGGTTEAALKVFEDSKFKVVVNKAITAAVDRCKQLNS